MVGIKQTHFPKYAMKSIWNNGFLKMKEIQYLETFGNCLKKIQLITEIELKISGITPLMDMNKWCRFEESS